MKATLPVVEELYRYKLAKIIHLHTAATILSSGRALAECTNTELQGVYTKFAP
jgi:hypothetical protein